MLWILKVTETLRNGSKREFSAVGADLQFATHMMVCQPLNQKTLSLKMAETHASTLCDYMRTVCTKRLLKLITLLLRGEPLTGVLKSNF